MPIWNHVHGRKKILRNLIFRAEGRQKHNREIMHLRLNGNDNETI